jgi:hydroxyethylthiazole kinase-like uncharacterized protein yjeF
MTDISSAGLTEEALAVIALENSGRSAALWALERWLDSERARPVVIAGQGGVGAAALVAARHLYNWGLNPLVYVIGIRQRLREEPAAALEVFDRIGGRHIEFLKIEQAEQALDQLDENAPLVYGTAGDSESQRATTISDMVSEAAAGRDNCLVATYSVRSRTHPPGESEPLVRVKTAARDRETMRLYDSTAIKEYGVPSLALMENAGFWAARELMCRLDDSGSTRVAVLAGKGNNGGDGFVIARHLAWWGVGDVKVYLAGASNQLIDDARVNFDYLGAPNVNCTEIAEPREASRHRAEIAEADWLVDALLGTGIAGKVRGVSAALLEVAQGINKPVLAVDTPSGLDATDGRVHGLALRATATVTFGVPKLGFEIGEGPHLVGDLTVADISLPRKITGAEVVFNAD